MGFRRVVVFVAALAAGTALALDAPPASAAMAPAPAASSAAAKTATTATAASSKAPAKSAKLSAAVKMGPLSGNPTVGKTKATTCAACHGADGNSTDPMFPKLAGQNEHYIVNQLENFKSGRRKNAIMFGMASSLSVKDMHDVAAYFASQTVHPGFADKKLAGPGGKIFHQGDAKRGIPACAACHEPDGRGNPGPPYPQLAGQHAQYVVQVLTAFHNGTAWGTTKHDMIMPEIAKRLTKKDIKEVASYIQGLHTKIVASQ